MVTTRSATAPLDGPSTVPLEGQMPPPQTMAPMQPPAQQQNEPAQQQNEANIASLFRLLQRMEEKMAGFDRLEERLAGLEAG